MKRRMILTGLALVSVSDSFPVFAAEDLVANPEKIFAKGMKVALGNNKAYQTKVQWRCDHQLEWQSL